jgi:predicted nucleic acid-binding protein
MRVLIATRRQVTDAYLLALAVRHNGVLATWDRGILGLAQGRGERLELLA